MTKKTLLLTLASGAILALGLSACANSNPAEGSDSSESSSSETSIEKELQIVAEPTKTTYVVGEYLDYSGLSVKKVTTTDGVSDGGVTMSFEALTFSPSEGTVVSEAQDNFTVTVADKNDDDVKPASFILVVKEKTTYTVTFKDYDGTVLATSSNKEGTVGVEYPGETPTREHDENYYYRFKGWFLEGDATETLVTLSNLTYNENFTLVAKYDSFDASSSDELYTYVYDGDSYAVAGFVSTDVKKATTAIENIPETFHNEPVDAIADGAFKQVTTLTSVTLPDNIKTVGKEAFYGAKGITTLDLGEGIVDIDEQAFRGLSNLTSLEIPSSVRTIAEQGFYGASNLSSLTINEGVEYIGADAFNAIAVSELSLPDSLVKVDVGVSKDGKPEGTPFTSLKKCEKITFGSGLSAEQIAGCGLNSKLYSVLQQVAVRDNNDKLKVVDNVLYNADMTQLCLYPALSTYTTDDGDTDYRTSFTIPDTVTEILPDAFWSSSSTAHLTSLKFGSGVKTIGDCAFYQLQGNVLVDFGSAQVETIGNLAFYYLVGGTEESGTNSKGKTTYKVTLPKTVKSVGDKAFGSNSYLTDFVFSSSMESFGQNIFYSCSALTSITFPEDSDLEMSEDGAFVYSDNYTKVIWYNSTIAVTSYDMPDTVTEVTPYLLQSNAKITSLTLSSNLKTVGEYAFQNMKVANDLVLPDTLETVGAYAFGGLSKVTSINFPTSLKSIGNYAFTGLAAATVGEVTISEGAVVGENAFNKCVGMTKLTLNATNVGASAFVACTGLTEATLSDEMTKLPDSLFKNDTALTSVNIPSKLEKIGSEVFSGDTALVSELTLPDTLTSIADKAFSTSSFASITVPSSVTSMGTAAFYASTASKIVLNNDLETLPNQTFYNAASLTSFELNGESLTAIGDYAFSGCAALETVTLPETVTTLGKESFKGMTSLTTFTGTGVTDISAGSIFYGDSALTTLTLGDFTETGSMTFYNCSKLENIPMPSTYTKLGASAYAGSGITSFTMTDEMYYDTSLSLSPWSKATKLESIYLGATVTSFTKGMFSDCNALTTITSKNTLTDIGSSAFDDCTSLTETPIDLKTATSIGGLAFNGCSGLKSINLPETEGYTAIEASTFYGCSSLSEVTIPSNIKTLNQKAFSHCTALSKVTFESVDVVFSNCSSYSVGVFNSTNLTDIEINATLEEASTLIGLFTAKTLGLKSTTITITCTDGTKSITTAKS